jgi:hypothetical protein
MVKTVNLRADIPANPASNASTLGELANSEFFGMWRDRADIEDSFEFARDLRSHGWKRSG